MGDSMRNQISEYAAPVGADLKARSSSSARAIADATSGGGDLGFCLSLYCCPRRP